MKKSLPCYLLCSFLESSEPTHLCILPESLFPSISKHCLDTDTLFYTWLSLEYVLGLGPLGMEHIIVLRSCTPLCGCAVTLVSIDEHLGGFQSSACVEDAGVVGHAHLSVHMAVLATLQTPQSKVDSG